VIVLDILATVGYITFFGRNYKEYTERYITEASAENTTLVLKPRFDDVNVSNKTFEKFPIFNSFTLLTDGICIALYILKSVLGTSYMMSVCSKSAIDFEYRYNEFTG